MFLALKKIFFDNLRHYSEQKLLLTFKAKNSLKICL